MVVGSRGLGTVTGLLVGSTAVALAAHGHSPVVVVRGTAVPGGPVVVGVDGSPASEAALAFAFEAASMRGVVLIALMTSPDFTVDSAYNVSRIAIDWAQVEEDERRLLAQRLAGWRSSVHRSDPGPTSLRTHGLPHCRSATAGPTLNGMNAADVMSSPAVTVNPSTTVRAASAMLGDRGFSALPVVDDEGRLVGIVSGADLLLAGMSPETANSPVSRVMRGSVISAPMTASPAELTATMLSQRLRCLPIVADGQVLVGVVSRSDLLRILTPADAVLAARVDAALRAYSGSPRWTVSVQDGEVSVSGPFSDQAERKVVEALVRTVPGVRGTQVAC